MPYNFNHIWFIYSILSTMCYVKNRPVVFSMAITHAMKYTIVIKKFLFSVSTRSQISLYKESTDACEKV